MTRVERLTFPRPNSFGREPIVTMKRSGFTKSDDCPNLRAGLS